MIRWEFLPWNGNFSPWKWMVGRRKEICLSFWWFDLYIYIYLSIYIYIYMFFFQGLWNKIYLRFFHKRFRCGTCERYDKEGLLQFGSVNPPWFCGGCIHGHDWGEELVIEKFVWFLCCSGVIVLPTIKIKHGFALFHPPKISNLMILVDTSASSMLIL